MSDLLRIHGLRAQKRLGQNFLCDRNTLVKIVRVANMTNEDAVVEIGAGLGSLTLALAESCRSVTAIEIDRHIEPILREMTAPQPNIELVIADFMKLDLAALFDTAFGDAPGVVVANIPYYITTPIIERLIEHKTRIRRAVLLVQQEVAARLNAAPGSDECGSISLWAQYHARVEVAGSVPSSVFLPQPDVNSAIVALTPVTPGTVIVENEARMFHMIRAGFGQRRKTLLNALLRAPASFGLGFDLDNRATAEDLLLRAGIDGTRRGETLTLPEYARLADTPAAQG